MSAKKQLRSAFDVLTWRSPTKDDKEPKESSLSKRQKATHLKTVQGVCLRCFSDKKNRFTISRYNNSSVERHIKQSHKGEEYNVTVVPEDDPRAHEAMRCLQNKTTRSMQSHQTGSQKKQTSHKHVTDSANVGIHGEGAITTVTTSEMEIDHLLPGPSRNAPVETLKKLHTSTKVHGNASVSSDHSSKPESPLASSCREEPIEDENPQDIPVATIIQESPTKQKHLPDDAQTYDDSLWVDEGSQKEPVPTIIPESVLSDEHTTLEHPSVTSVDVVDETLWVDEESLPLDDEASFSETTAMKDSVKVSCSEKPKKSQKSLKHFFRDVNQPGEEVDVNALSVKLDKLLTLLSKQEPCATPGTQNTTAGGDIPGHTSNNLAEFITTNEDMELIEDQDGSIVRCKICYEYLNSKPSLKKTRLPSAGNLSTGMALSNDNRKRCLDGHNNTWYRLKKRMLDHFKEGSKTHTDATSWWYTTRSLREKQSTALQNQIRTALGVVKTKSASLAYEKRIAELYMAGAEVGNFGHSRNIFNDILKVADAYIDKEIKSFLQRPLPNTSFPPHYYITADKSTNHRETNQISMICPVIDGVRAAIPLAMRMVYADSSGSGGLARELATKLYEDLNENAGVQTDTAQLMYAQGRVFDGQYLSAPFITKMQEPIETVLEGSEESSEDLVDLFWWPIQWDPAHWLDLVFSKFKGDEFLTRLIGRTNHIHHIFGHGKMHSVAKHTSVDLEMPFKVTTSFAPQRFMRSSFLQFVKLESSLPTYIETFRDHDNSEQTEYKIAGNDFVFDLLGSMDMLWPIVLLMLRGQQVWCPGWKMCGWLPTVFNQLKRFNEEIGKNEPDKTICPRIHMHGEDVKQMKYKDVELVEGWLIVASGDKKNDETAGEPTKKGPNPIQWYLREIPDCVDDLRSLATKIHDELKARVEKCVPPLLYLLHACLDFGVLFNGLCGSRSPNGKLDVNKTEVAKIGREQFRRCVAFVSALPHIQEADDETLELSPELADVIFWRLKKTLHDIIWGEHFQSLFPTFFKAVSDEDPNKLVSVTLQSGDVVSRFQRAEGEFDLHDKYKVELRNGRHFTAVLQEDMVVKSLYCDAKFYQEVGREFCIIYDALYAKAGTEAVAESFYRVVGAQEKDGGQHLATLARRSRIDWCLPDVIQCERPIREMSTLYLKGDKTLNLSKHHVPIYKDTRSIRNASKMSKVLTRLATTPAPLSFLV